MRVNYYGYSVRKLEDNSHYLMDLSGFIKAFIAHSGVEFKRKFKHSDENVYLLPMGGNFHLFIVAKSDEIIKKITSNDAGVQVNEIDDMLQRDESLGFASYLYFDKFYFAFASKMLSPKTPVFANFINDIFKELSISDYSFDVHPFLQQSTREEILTMPFLGRSTIQIDENSSAWEDMKNFLKGESRDFISVDSFEITIKPKRGQSIKDDVSSFLDSISDAGLRKMTVKARDDLDDKLKDMYVNAQGAIADMITSKGDRVVLDEILSKIENNRQLKEKIEEHEQNDSFTKQNIENIFRFNTASNWCNTG